MTNEQRQRFRAACEHAETIRIERGKMRRAGATVIPYIVDQPAAINESTVFIEEWQPGQYTVGDVRLYLRIPYKCVQAIDSTANPAHTPDVIPAHWMQYHGTSPETARPYIQPLGSHDAYQVDEYAIEGGVVYRCKVAATVYPPSMLPGSWEVVGSAVEPDDPTEPGGDEPVPELGTLANPIPYPETGGTFAVANGKYYSYKGKVYLAKADMPSCVWPPDTGIWQWELVG